MLKIDYVPRHRRIGVCITTEDLHLEAFHEVSREIPVLSDSGDVLYTERVITRIPASDSMSKFKVEDFRLSALQKAGVPLKMVNINRSAAFTIDELERIAQNVDGAEIYVNRVLAQQKERESWFKLTENDSENENENKLNN